MEPTKLIAFLNAVRVGDLDGIRGKLRQGREACEELARPELSSLLKEAEESLDRGDLKTYRKRMETVIARLGHLR